MDLRFAAAPLTLITLSSCGGAPDQADRREDGVLVRTDASCTLKSLPVLPDVRITSVTEQAVPVPHCFVSGVIGTETNFELLLPEAWNGSS